MKNHESRPTAPLSEENVVAYNQNGGRGRGLDRGRGCGRGRRRGQGRGYSRGLKTKKVMNPNLSLGKICLGEDVVGTANSGQKKAMIFYQMDTEEVSDRFVALCFINGLKAYDGEINLGVEENMILNEYVVKLCLEHEVKRGNKVVKKDLIVALRGKIYFVKFIINPEEDDVEPGMIFGRSLLRLTKAITDFEARTITIYPDIDPFLEETEEEKSNDDWDHLLDFNIDDIPLLEEEGLQPFVGKMVKSSRNKKLATENLNFFYQDIGTSSSANGHLTQEEAAKEALAIKISRKFALLMCGRRKTSTREVLQLLRQCT
ncbi:hypothetical protein Tco_0355543 [Tanacetum coccineum]